MKRLFQISFIMAFAAVTFVPVSASANGVVTAMRAVNELSDMPKQAPLYLANNGYVDNNYRAAPQDKRRNVSSPEQLRRTVSPQLAPQQLAPQLAPRSSSDQAYTRDQPSYQPPYLSASVNVSASEAKSIALQSVPGSEYVDIKLIGGKTYRVRVVKNGHRIDVFVDAITGNIS